MPDDLAAARRALYRRGASDEDRDRYERLSRRATVPHAVADSDADAAAGGRRPARPVWLAAGAAAIAALAVLTLIGVTVRPAPATDPGARGAVTAAAGEDARVSYRVVGRSGGDALDLAALPYGWRTPRIADLQHRTHGDLLLHTVLRQRSSEALLVIACAGSRARFRAVLRVHGDRFGRPIAGRCDDQAIEGVDLPGGNGSAEVRVTTSGARAWTAALLTQ